MRRPRPYSADAPAESERGKNPSGRSDRPPRRPVYRRFFFRNNVRYIYGPQGDRFGGRLERAFCLPEDDLIVVCGRLPERPGDGVACPVVGVQVEEVRAMNGVLTARLKPYGVDPLPRRSLRAAEEEAYRELRQRPEIPREGAKPHRLLDRWVAVAALIRALLAGAFLWLRKG